jgi:hypothetical protein
MSERCFLEPPNVAVIADKKIFENNAPILAVTHDADDGCWGFHASIEDVVQTTDYCVVSLGTMVARDASLAELPDLLPGWVAQRPVPGAAWQRMAKD